jgi:hypothetical protein
MHRRTGKELLVVALGPVKIKNAEKSASLRGSSV